MAAKRRYEKVRNLNIGNTKFELNQIVSENTAIRELLYSLPIKGNDVISEYTLRSYKTLHKKGELSPNIIENILKSSGFEKGKSDWKFTNKIK